MQMGIDIIVEVVTLNRMVSGDNKSSDAQKEETSPTVVPVQVQCEGFRCLAYRDKDGTWKDFHTGKTLVGNVRVIEYQSE